MSDGRGDNRDQKRRKSHISAAVEMENFAKGKQATTDFFPIYFIS